jgi:hypothetical protein
MRNHLIALLFAVPGILLAMAAMPLLLGEWAILAGVFLAFFLPICWYASAPPQAQ